MLIVDKGASWEDEGLAALWRIAEARMLAGRVAELIIHPQPPGYTLGTLDEARAAFGSWSRLEVEWDDPPCTP